MNVEKSIRLIAGVFILASVLLGIYHNPAWFYFTGFVGINLFQSALTNKCPMIFFLKKAGIKSCS